MDFVVPKRVGDRSAPGPWWWPLVFTEDGKSATIKCPQCNNVYVLTEHIIHDDGSVKPSIVCPTVGCGWHVFARLEGWPP